MTEKPPPRPSKPPPRPVSVAPLRSAQSKKSVVGGAAGPPPPIPRPPPRTTTAPAPISMSGEEPTKLFAGNTLESAELVVVDGTYKGTVVPLGAGTVIIGRSSECELPLKGAVGVSRRHCKVQYLSNKFVVIDLESRNGTIVNGNSVERKVLENGDVIEVGAETVKFVVESLNDVRNAAISDDMEDAETALLPPTTTAAAQSMSTPRTNSAGSSAQQQETGAFNRPPPAPATSDEAPPVVDGRPPPLLPDVEDGPPLTAEALPPPLPPEQAQPELSTPYMHQPASKKSKAPLVFALLTLGVIAVGGFLVYDIFFKDKGAGDDVVVTNPLDTPPAPPPVPVDAPPLPPAPLPPAPPPAPVDTPAPPSPPPAPVDTPAPPPSPPPAPVETPPPPSPPPTGGTLVRAKGGGRAVSIVEVGTKVNSGDMLLMIGPSSPNLGRKLEALRREEREFADAAKSDPSIRRELDNVRAELRRTEAQATPKTITSPKAGTVTEVLVKVGDVVRDGAPVIRLGD